MNKEKLQLALYKISLAIGCSNKLEVMLGEVSERFHNFLDVLSIHLYRDTGSHYELAHASKSNPDEEGFTTDLINQLREIQQQSQQSLIEHKIAHRFIYFYVLDDYGFLLFSTPESWAGEALLSGLDELKPILILAIEACEDHAALQENRQKLLETQSLAKIGSWELDLTSNTLWWSDETYRIFEMDPETSNTCYECFLELIHPQDRQKVIDAYQSSVKSGELYQLEHRLLFPDGRIKHVVESGRTILLNGKAIRSIGSIQDITDRKEAEQALKVQENELSAIIEAIPLTLFVKDAKDLRFVRFNSAAEQLMGFAREEILGKNDYDFFPKEQADHFVADDRNTLRSGKIKNVSVEEINTPHGQRLLHTIKTPILDEEGEPKYLLGISEDITDLKAAEKQLQKSEEYLTYAQSVAKIGHYLVDAKSGEWESSKELDRIFGFGPDDKRNFASWQARIHPDDWPLVDDYLQKMFTEQLGLKDIYYRIINKQTNQLVWIHDVGHVSYDEDGQFVEMFGIAQDITKRKQTELALESSEKKLTELYNAIDDAIFLLGVEEGNQPGKFIEVNDVACEWLGYQREDLLKLSPFEIDGRSNPASIEQNVTDALKYERVEFETTLVSKTGESFPIEMRVSLVDYQGKKVLMAIARDISARKQSEASLQLSSIVIENLVEGIMICDNRNRLISVNPAFTEITGYTLDEVKGKNPSILKSGRQTADFYQQMWDSIKNFGSWQGEIWNRRFNGEIYPEWLSISCIRNGEGEIVNYIGVFSDISTIKENEAELRFLAHHDPLTKLPNRVLLNDRIEHALQQIERKDGLIAVMYLDLDRFKAINDSFGHPHGDQLLQIIAVRLQHALRAEDTICRVSGDEFVILLEELSSADEAGMIAQKVLSALGEPVMLDEHEITITASIGIAMAPVDGTEPVQLVKNADIALYRAKDLGRNNFEFFSSDMTTSSFETLFMLNGLYKALDNKEFVIHYQPQINMQNAQVVGVEALVRWLHPDIGLVPPGKFIPLAEDSGIIIKIGEWVLREACLQMKRWLDEKLPINYIAVNISGRQLLDKNFLYTVKQALEDAGIAGRYIELEVTETLVMKETSYSQILQQLKELGVRISIDDFGTGYSSLVRLKHLPIDKLKIDMSFIKGVPADEENSNITQTIINLAHSMKLEVLAEGVELAEQAEFLVARECFYAQGYLYSPPVPEQELQKWIFNQ